MNPAALLAVLVFAGAFISIYGSIFFGAWKSYKKGELDPKGIRLLKLGFLGHLAVFGVLAITAFLV